MRRSVSVIASLLCASALSSCSSLSVNNLPQPGNDYSAGYEITLEFANVLNLPDHAKVVKDGTTIGMVDQVHLGKTAVEVTARIDPSVKVPSDAGAVLQQATVLGDIYVALERPKGPSDDAPPLRPGQRIPLAHTVSPPQLEDTLANLATFVGSGSIQRIQNTIVGINRISPERTEQIRGIASRMSADLADLSANIDTDDHWLQGVAQTADVLVDSAPQLQRWFSPSGMLAAHRVLAASSYLGVLLPSVGSISNGGYWLVPLLNSLSNAFGEIQRSKWAIEGEYRPWRKLFTDVFLPEDKYPAMNITSVQTADGREISGNVQDVLRMLGAIP